MQAGAHILYILLQFCSELLHNYGIPATMIKYVAKILVFVFHNAIPVIKEPLEINFVFKPFLAKKEKLLKEQEL